MDATVKANHDQLHMLINNAGIGSGFADGERQASAAYSQSKLAQILHTLHMAEKYDAAKITFNTLHPATMMDTTLVRQMSSPARTTVDEGATALINLATSPDLTGRTGLDN